MGAFDPAGERPGAERYDGTASGGSLLDLLRVAMLVLDADGRIVLWSPEAEELYGYPAGEVLGRGGLLLVPQERRAEVATLFERVLSGERWSGSFPIRGRDGSVRDVEFRNVRLRASDGRVFTLAMGARASTVRRVETSMAVASGLVDQSPLGLAVFGPDLRCVRANRALAGMTGVPVGDLLGRPVARVVPAADATGVEEAVRRVLATGSPVLDRRTVCRGSPAGGASGVSVGGGGWERTWSVSCYRLDGEGRRTLGLAVSVQDISRQVREANEAAEARARLAVIAEAGTRIGTTLDLWQTARELATVTVPRLADLASVDVLDAVLGDAVPGSEGRGAAEAPDRPTVFRALAVAAGYPTGAMAEADPVGASAGYDPSRLLTRSVHEGRPLLVPRVDGFTLRRIARDDAAAAALDRAGVHSYLAAPLIARGEVLGAISLYRTVNPRPFDREDQLLACELAARAAISIDNARLYGRERDAALTLQRSLLPGHPPQVPGMEIAARYLPAVSEVGGDWFDVLPLADGQVGLITGDVMGKGVHAAAIMGQLRSATRAFARLGLPPDRMLAQLDGIAESLGDSIATCVYALCDPATGRCLISTAGHLPPVLVHPDGRVALVEIPDTTPLGVGALGGAPFGTATCHLDRGSMLALFTDGLVEDRRRPIDAGLQDLKHLLAVTDRPLEEVADQIIGTLPRRPDDDVALLLARRRGVPGVPGGAGPGPGPGPE
jgi:PAS domain S-box-containing protein